MQVPLPNVIVTWNVNNIYSNAARGSHEIKNMTPATGLIPEGATAREVASSIDYSPGETSTGIATTSSISMESTSGPILVTLLINSSTDVAVN